MSELCGFPLEMVNEARAIQSTVQRLFPLLLQTTTVEPCVPLISRLVQELLELKGMATSDTCDRDDKEMMQRLYDMRSKLSEGDVEAIRAYLAHWSVPEVGVEERVEELLPLGRDELDHNNDPFALDHVNMSVPPPTDQPSDHPSITAVEEDERHADSFFGPTLPSLPSTLDHKSPTPAADEPCPKTTTTTAAAIDAVSEGTEGSEQPAQPSLLDLLRLPGPAMSEMRSSQITPPVATCNANASGASRAMNTSPTLASNTIGGKPDPSSTSLTHEAPPPSPAATVARAPKVTTGRLSSFMAELRGQLDISHDLTSGDQW